MASKTDEFQQVVEFQVVEFQVVEPTNLDMKKHESVIIINEFFSRYKSRWENLKNDQV